jgi:hypothetical protein
MREMWQEKCLEGITRTMRFKRMGIQGKAMGVVSEKRAIFRYINKVVFRSKFIVKGGIHAKSVI